jgi:hypothetical protein
VLFCVECVKCTGIAGLPLALCCFWNIQRHCELHAAHLALWTAKVSYVPMLLRMLLHNTLQHSTASSYAKLSIVWPHDHLNLAKVQPWLWTCLHWHAYIKAAALQQTYIDRKRSITVGGPAVHACHSKTALGCTVREAGWGRFACFTCSACCLCQYR